MSTFALRTGYGARPPRRPDHLGALQLSFLTGLIILSAAAVLVSVVVAAIVTWAPAEIHGDSMEPTLHSGDQVVVRYKPAELHRGDIVVLVGVGGYKGPAS
jgi:signal peptidase I